MEDKWVSDHLERELRSVGWLPGETDVSFSAAVRVQSAAIELFMRPGSPEWG